MEILKSFLGSWAGTCKVWLKPDELSDESPVEGQFTPLLDGNLVRHTYQGSMQDKPRSGEETLAFNPAEQRFEVSWFDSFHMSYGILFSTGEKTAKGFTVLGHYGIGPGQKPWGWRTEYELIDADHLTITAYNITPDGAEAKGVETVYERQGS